MKYHYKFFVDDKELPSNVNNMHSFADYLISQELSDQNLPYTPDGVKTYLKMVKNYLTHLSFLHIYSTLQISSE